MTTAEKRFYAYAESIREESDPTDVVCIFKSRNWELAGTYTNTYYLIYYANDYKDTGTHYSWEFGNLEEALDFVVPEAGVSLHNVLRQINFDLVMTPSGEADMQLLY